MLRYYGLEQPSAFWVLPCSLTNRAFLDPYGMDTSIHPWMEVWA
jgi:hypothetical protein